MSTAMLIGELQRQIGLLHGRDFAEVYFEANTPLEELHQRLLKFGWTRIAVAGTSGAWQANQDPAFPGKRTRQLRQLTLEEVVYRFPDMQSDITRALLILGGA